MARGPVSELIRVSTLTMRRSLIVIMVAIMTGCASSARPKTPTPCVLPAADSVFAITSPLYPACAVERQALRLETNVHPDFPMTGRSGCISADVEVVVDSLGRPEAQTARIVRSNNQTFGEAVLAIVPLWRFTPAICDNRPVRQLFVDHEAVRFVTVAVPAGTRPSPPSRSQMPPSCSP
jgi:hypothetical protein